MAAGQDDRSDPPPLTLGDARLSRDRADRPWGWRLAVSLRALAVVEFAKGLAHWALLIGAGGTAEPLAGASPGWFVATVFFAVADPVAAVGLWVGAPWGVAIWLIAAVGQIVAVSVAGPSPGGWAIVAATVAAMTAYVALSMKARHEAR